MYFLLCGSKFSYHDRGWGFRCGDNEVQYSFGKPMTKKVNQKIEFAHAQAKPRVLRWFLIERAVKKGKVTCIINVFFWELSHQKCTNPWFAAVCCEMF